MSSRINTNMSSLMATRHLSGHSRNVSENSLKLSSGSRIVRAADDAAGLSISTVMNAQIRGKRQASRNANDAISIVQVAEGAMNELSAMLSRMRELGIHAASDTVGSDERDMIDMETQQLKNEIDRISQATKWNNSQLLTGQEHSFDIQVDTHNGANQKILIETFDLAQSPHALGIYDIRMDSQLQAKLSLEKLDYAINEVSKSRSKLGAYQSRFESAIQNLSISDENLSAAKSGIKDADYAKEVSKNVKDKIMQEAAVSTLQSANLSSAHVLKLLG